MNGWQLTLVILAFFLVPFALYINWLILHNLCPTDRGTMGDMFGVVNAMFTGLAFAGVVLTVILQRNDLKTQKEELINAKIEAGKQKTLLEIEAAEQKAVLNIQRFETTFFNMLNLQNEIVKNIKYGSHSGRTVFDDAYKKLLIMLCDKNAISIFKETADTTHSIIGLPKDLANAKDSIEDKYFEGYYNNFASAFNHYFRHLYHIFKFIYFSELTLKDKLFYGSLCRAQLSQNELFVIAFNILIDDYGKPKFLYLVKEYDILKNFDHNTIDPHLYWDLISNEIRNVAYPFTDKIKPKDRVVE